MKAQLSLIKPPFKNCSIETNVGQPVGTFISIVGFWKLHDLGLLTSLSIILFVLFSRFINSNVTRVCIGHGSNSSYSDFITIKNIEIWVPLPTSSPHHHHIITTSSPHHHPLPTSSPFKYRLMQYLYSHCFVWDGALSNLDVVSNFAWAIRKSISSIFQINSPFIVLFSISLVFISITDLLNSKFLFSISFTLIFTSSMLFFTLAPPPIIGICG